MSKTQIDRLGDRLKKGGITDDDLRLLDTYRRSFTEAYGIVIGDIRQKLKLEPTGRPAKSTTSVSDKLRRESIRLTQIQDIAGCRIIVLDIANQNEVVESLENLFENVSVVDRRERPSHGYRAVHLIINLLGKPIEIQVRTAMQHLWAELSEKYSDVVNPAIKYGGGDEEIQTILRMSSTTVAVAELSEILLAGELSSQSNLTDAQRQELAYVQNKVDKARQGLFTLFRNSIKKVEKSKGKAMIFLIEYDRIRGSIVSFKEFGDSQRQLAEEMRLEMEIELNRRGTEREVILLEAATEKALRRTHRRYFENLSELAGAPS